MSSKASWVCMIHSNYSRKLREYNASNYESKKEWSLTYCSD